MSAQDAVTNIRAKQGLGDKSFDPDFHADQVALVNNECTKHWHKVTDSEVLLPDDFRRIDAFANESATPSDITLTIPATSTLSAGYHRDVYNDSVDTYLVFLQKDAADGGGQLIVDGLEAGEAVSFALNDAGDDFVLVDIKGKAPVPLDATVFGDFDAIINATKPSNTYTITGTGSQFPNPPDGVTLQPTTPYTWFKELVNTGDAYVEEFLFFSAFDTSNKDIGRRFVRAGGNFGGAVASGWKPVFAPESFAVAQLSAQSVSGDPTAPTFLNNLTAVDPLVGFEISATSGSVRNISGENMQRAVGSFALQVEKSGGGGANSLYIWSEQSPDETNWTLNPNSLRKIEIENNGESYYAISSFVKNWGAGNYVRFKLAETGTGDLDLIPSTVTTDLGAVSGLAAFWTMARVG